MGKVEKHGTKKNNIFHDSLNMLFFDYTDRKYD